MPPVRLDFSIGITLIKSTLNLALIFGVVAVVFFSISTTSFAQDQIESTKTDIYANTDDNVSRSLHNYYQIAFIEFSSALVCQLAGVNPLGRDHTCIDLNPITKKLGYPAKGTPSEQAHGGLTGLMSQMIGKLFIPPISTQQQINYFAANFGIGAQKTYAQGTPTGQGFIGLNAVQDLFIKVRNIAYLLIVILFIVIGIAIMIRVKIDPRTVMSIQNQIPKIIIGIIFMTFSYAIAGMLIDTMWTITYFGINTMTSGSQLCETQAKPLQAVATRQVLNNPVAFLTDLLGDETGCFGSVDGISGLAIDVGKTFGDTLSRITLAVFGMNEDLESCNPGSRGWKIWGVLDVQDCLKKGMFGFLKYLIALIAGLIMFFSIVIAMIRIWFTLLKAYISFTLAVILAPFWILVGILPGGGLGFMQWLRHMISHLAVFPATVLMLLLAVIFAGNNTASDPQNAFLPPLIGNPNAADGMGTLMAFAVILLTPDLLSMVREALKTTQGKYTGNITGRAKSANPLGVVNTGGQYAYHWQALRSMKDSIFRPSEKPAH